MSSLSNSLPLPDDGEHQEQKRKNKQKQGKDPTSVEGLEDFFVPLTQAVIDGGLTVKQSADYYGISGNRVKELIRSGDIPAVRVMTYKGKKWRVFPGGLPDHVYDALQEFQSRRHCQTGGQSHNLTGTSSGTAHDHQHGHNSTTPSDVGNAASLPGMIMSFEPPPAESRNNPPSSLINFDPASFGDDQAGLIDDLMSLTLETAFGKRAGMFRADWTAYDNADGEEYEDERPCHADMRPRKVRPTRQDRTPRPHMTPNDDPVTVEPVGPAGPKSSVQVPAPSSIDVIEHLLSQVKDLESRLESSYYRNGYLEGQIAAMQDAQRVLSIRQHTNPWWVPVLRLLKKQDPCH